MAHNYWKFLNTIFFLTCIGSIIYHHQYYIKEGKWEKNLEFQPWLVPAYMDFLVLFLALLVAYVVQVFLQNTGIATPYCAFIIMFGFLLGILSYDDDVIRHSLKVMKLSPLEIVHIYFPILLFCLSFCMDVFIFLKTLPQIVVIGVPVSLTTALISGTMVKHLVNPEWPATFGFLIGVLCIPVYPKSATYLLKQQNSRTRQISVLLEGEAIITIVIANMTQELVSSHTTGFVVYWYQFLMVGLRFVIMDALTGYISGLTGRYLIRKLYTSEMSIFLVCFTMPFLTYSISNGYISGCGSLSVVILGVMMGTERAILSNETESFLIDFWEMIAFILDIIICITSALTAATYVLPHIFLRDYVFIFAIYLLYYIVRFVCFLLFSPITSRLGYGMDLKNMIVCVWSGLKGPTSLTLVGLLRQRGFNLEVAAKFYFYIIGLYFLSITVNGSFTNTILEFLGLKHISTARQMNMNNCMKQLFKKRERTIAVLKMDRFLGDTNWPVVIEATNIKHPYKINLEEEDDENFFFGYRFTYCSECKKDVALEPTPREEKEMTREARMRILKTKKMSYSRQYANGMMSREGIRILYQAVELAMDSESAEIKVEDLYKKFTEENYFEHFIRKRAKNLQRKKKSNVKPPRTYWRRLCYHMVVTSRKFDKLMLIIITMHLGLIAVDMIYHPSVISSEKTKPRDLNVEWSLLTGKIIFALIYVTEFIIRILAYSWIHICSHGFRTYFKSFWNITDFIVMIGCVLGAIHAIYDAHQGFHRQLKEWGSDKYEQILDILQLLRVLRLLRIFEIFYTDIIQYLDNVADKKMAFSYELGKSYAIGETEILDMLPHIIDNNNIRLKEQHKIEKNRVFTTKLLGTVQKERPWIAITVKTTQAIRTILNGMNEAINTLKTAGWIDRFEYDKLCASMSDLHKKVNSITKVHPSPPKVIFKEVAWMAEDEAVIDFLFENVTAKKFEPGDVIFREGNVADGIYIVVTGLFMISYKPDPYILNSLREYGRLPIVDYLSSTKYEEATVDYIVSGNCIGELSMLTDRCYNCVITADAHSQVYVLSSGVLKRAMELSTDPVKGLECRIWKEVSVRIAVSVLISVPAYQAFSQNQIKYVLERAFVPDLSRYKIFVVNDMIEDIVLVEGVVSDFNTRDMYIAPCWIPRTVQRLILPTSSLLNIPINIETKLLIIPTKNVDEYDVMMVAEETCEMTSDSSTKCLQHIVQTRLRNQNRMRRLKNRSNFSKYSHVRTQGSSRSHAVMEPSAITYFRTEMSESASVFIPPDIEYETQFTDYTTNWMPQTDTSSSGQMTKRKQPFFDVN